MSPTLLFSFVLAYFALLLGVAWYTSRNSTNETFFIGNRNSNWMLVAFGMIGTSLSGVTFVSVPGKVGIAAFSYFQVVIGYIIGYIVVAFVLLPLYYKMNLTSIYNYLLTRFNFYAYKTGALFFIISRTLGATARLYLVINVLQIFILDTMGVPFFVTAFVILLMILLYTFEGGVRTIVFTDTLQTTFMLLGLIVCVFYIMSQLNLSMSGTWQALELNKFTHIFNTDVKSGDFFLKSIIGGAFITIGMTGLDQEMMQKNISVRTLKDSQKNMITLSILQAVVVFIFLVLGGLLYVYAMSKGGSFEQVVVNGKQQLHFLLDGKNVIGDNIFPEIAFSYLPPIIGVIFIIGLISALFPSADGALTALTSSLCIDIIGLNRKEEWAEKKRKRIRMTVHLIMAVVFLLCVLVFKWIDNKSIIDIILKLAGYTYGPLLGLFSFGILTKRSLPESIAVTIVTLVAPALCYLVDINATKWFGGYQVGIELLIINGLFTFIGLLIISKSNKGDSVDLTSI
ncbi:sodium:solute symporter [Ferruginibacter sp.]|uniref:sodium:solute symporter n=1 Tax=Ferruginibacter sp. TaxID=1940288 RepID=UPI0019C80CF6|nr:sodium:solute symporter [Ferruginibacter sp.]MBC7629469.1 sodium:solute symporter [Ferruginibacter sp.]